MSYLFVMSVTIAFALGLYLGMKVERRHNDQSNELWGKLAHAAILTVCTSDISKPGANQV